ncbi:zinc-binding dehydrogenase [Streptomyces marispadix]|uniref:zinc-binding dehydrogenase n=1 Tax=Streptomyces marispadix TaxID=2922868 RepID=UPI003556D1F5
MRAASLRRSGLRTDPTQLELIGWSFGTHEDFAQVLRHIQAGELRPLLACTCPLHELRAAQEEFAEKHFFGKLVVIPDAGPAHH